MPSTESTIQPPSPQTLIDPEYGYGWLLIGTTPKPLEIEMPELPKQPPASRVKSRVSACPGSLLLASLTSAVPRYTAKPLAMVGQAHRARHPLSSPSSSLRCRARTRCRFPTRQLALRLRHPRLVFRCGHRRAHADKHTIAARPTSLRHLVMIMDSASIDLLDLPDNQTIAVKVSSPDNQVPRPNSLYAVHSHDLTRVPALYQPQRRGVQSVTPNDPQLQQWLELLEGPRPSERSTSRPSGTQAP
jgi:hypothetical protein